MRERRLGFLISESDNFSSVTYVYNDAGQIASTTQSSVGGPTVTLDYQYTNGHRTQMAATIDGTADFVDDYVYDSLGRVVSVTEHGVTGGNAVAAKQITLVYNDAGQLLSIDRYQDGVLAVEGDYGYDANGRLTSLLYHQGDTILNSYAWTYSGDSVVATASPSAPWSPTGGLMPVHDTTGVTDALMSGGFAGVSLLTSCTSNDGVASYSYDPAGQLIGVSRTGGQAGESYTWDANGNRIDAGYVIGADNRLLSDGTYRYEYDAEGNRVARWTDVNADGVLDAGDTNITQYAWDNRNRLVQVTDYDVFGGDATQIVDYFYDVENRWIGEAIDKNGDGVVDHQIRFVHDGNQIVLRFEKDGDGAVTGEDTSHRYLSAVDQVFADEQVVNPQAAGNVVWPLADNLGTVRDLAVNDPQTGITSVANHRIYDSFGNLKSQTNAAVDCLFGFTGLPFDKASGTYRTPTRPYDPSTGRWTQPDWIKELGGQTNLYVYCGNSPTNATDPTGTISRTKVGERKSGPGQLTVNWKFQLDKTYDEPIVLIQRVEVTAVVPYTVRGVTKTRRATTSYFEVVGVIYPGETEIRREGRNYDDTWSLQATEVGSFGAGLSLHLTTGSVVMRGQIRAFKQSDVNKQISGWQPGQTFQGGSGTNTGFPMTSGTFPASQAFYGLWNTKWVESETSEGKAFVHTETITHSQPTVSGGFSPQSGNPWFPKPHH